MRPAVLAHRGRLPGFRENTIEAFVECGRRGADGIELDARRSADGALVVHHDAEVAGVGVIADLPVAALPEWIPLLGAVLDACAGLDVNVEIKNDPRDPGFDVSGSLATAVAGAVGGYRECVTVSCFHLPTLDFVRSANPEVATAWLTVRLDGGSADLAEIAARGHSGVNPHHLAVDGALVEAAHGLGLEVATWTVNEPARIRELASLGVDAVITDELRPALEALGE